MPCVTRTNRVHKQTYVFNLNGIEWLVVHYYLFTIRVFFNRAFGSVDVIRHTFMVFLFFCYTTDESYKSA